MNIYQLLVGRCRVRVTDGQSVHVGVCSFGEEQQSLDLTRGEAAELARVLGEALWHTDPEPANERVFVDGTWSLERCEPVDGKENWMLWFDDDESKNDVLHSLDASDAESLRRLFARMDDTCRRNGWR